MARNNNKRGGLAVAERPLGVLARLPVRVSYPKDGDTIAPPDYTIQVATEEPAAGVDVCINQGEWEPCREALGLWWFDWRGLEPGEHEIVARLRRLDGSMAASEPCIVFVKPA